jgi:hypothetical protein
VIDPVQVALLVANALDACGLKYVVGGSLASSLSGEPRSTLDVDIVVAITEADVDGFRRALGPDFYADDPAIQRAIRNQSTVNLIHQPSAIKIDIFVAGGTPLDAQQLERRQRVQVSANPDRHFYVYTPEDILLQKLRCFRRGNETSDRQWRDVLGILLVQGDAIDREYLLESAAPLGVSDLLQRAFQDIGKGKDQA